MLRITSIEPSGGVPVRHDTAIEATCMVRLHTGVAGFEAIGFASSFTQSQPA